MNKGDKINSDETLYRRGYNSPLKKFLNPDGSATSRVFKPRPKDNGKLSVDLANLTTMESSITDENQYNLFELLNSVVEEIGLETVYDPSLNNIAHSLIQSIDILDDISPAYLAKRAKKIFPL